MKVLQILLCILSPTQSSPPFCGEGSVQLLFRDRTPPPQLTLQADQESQ